MQYTLSNGEKVNLYSNNDVAKFVILKLPELGLSFAGDVPHMRHTPYVDKYLAIAKRLSFRRALDRRRRLEEKLNRRPDQALYDACFDEDDDDYCPF